MDNVLIENIKDLNIDKVGKKAMDVVAGLIFGALGVIIFSKFIEDNFDFRIPSIANKPAKTIDE